MKHLDGMLGNVSGNILELVTTTGSEEFRQVVQATVCASQHD